VSPVAAGTRIRLAEAEALAEELRTLLGPVCLQIEVAGSVRRQRPDIGDIELLAIPLWQTRLDLFGESNQPPISQLETLCAELIRDGTFELRLDVNGRHAVGPKYKRLRFRGTGVDLFTAHPDNWGLLMVIRTGPAGYSKRLVTPQRHGGWLPGHLVVKDGFVWSLAAEHKPGEKVPIPNEGSLYALLGREFDQPEDRRDP